METARSLVPPKMGYMREGQGTVPCPTSKGSAIKVKKAVSIISHILLIILYFCLAIMHNKGLVEYNDPSGVPYNLAATLLFYIISTNAEKKWYKMLMSVFTVLGFVSCILLFFV